MMGLLFVESLPGQKLFRCILCGVDIASAEDVLSQEFNGRSGPACVVARVVNITFSQNEPPPLVTGLNEIADAHCSSCQQLIGWRFDRVRSAGSKFWEGMYALELSNVVKHGW